MLAIRYSLFAIVATLLNLFFQYLSFEIYDGVGSLYVAMFFGTLSGLVAKYILDKKFIFYHVTENKKDDAKKFVLYSFMGIFTTIIFWATEMAFDWYFESEVAKYYGAVVGLSIGYVVKYFLDKKFVFKEKLA
ncbi:MAG: GtrA family protein [Gammaproteobacteria bacterium]|nr:GtrA family protein [Gammaproteobacteria bacterium]